MFKKVAFVGVGLLLIASPLLVSAQNVAVQSDASLIASLTALVQQLEQQVQQLIAAHNNVVPIVPSISSGAPCQAPGGGPCVAFSASPTSGTAPLTVTLQRFCFECQLYL